jgi:hypothetical protein
MAENYLTLVKSFVRKNGLHNIISIHTMALNEHRINFFVETKEEPKVEAIKAVSPGLGNWIQAALGETHTTHHRVGSTYDGMYERILHGMGFRHIDETNTQFINSYLYESSQRQKEDKKFIMDAYLDDPSEENRHQLILWGISDKQLKQYKDSREKSSRDRATGDETKKKSKKPKTEAQKKDDELRAWMK